MGDTYNIYELYEQEKAKLADMNLPCAKYDEALRELVERLGI